MIMSWVIMIKQRGGQYPGHSESLRNERAFKCRWSRISFPHCWSEWIWMYTVAICPNFSSHRVMKNNKSVLSSQVINQTKIVLLSTVNCLLRDDSGNNYRACAISDQGAINSSEFTYKVAWTYLQQSIML